MLRPCARRTGIAAVELAVLLPLLAFLFVIAIDFARLFFFSLTVTNCARNGALYGSDPAGATLSPYKSVTEAALSDAGNLDPAPTVNSKTVIEVGATYIEVTVAYPFSTITKYPGVPSSLMLTRTVRMRMTQAVPNF